MQKAHNGIHYEVTGKGKPIVFLHGMGLNGTIFINTIKKLKGYRCVNIDLRGHGKSTRKHITLEQYLQDIDAIITAEKLIKPTLVGHSFGSFLSMHYAARNKNEGRLILINEVHKLKFLNLTLPFVLFGMGYFKVMDWLVLLCKRRRHFIDFAKHQRDGINKLAFLGQISSLPRTIVKCIGIMKKNPVPLRKIKNRSIIVNGLHDEIISQHSYRELHQALKGSAVVKEEAEHLLPITHPEMVEKVIKKYIN